MHPPVRRHLVWLAASAVLAMANAAEAADAPPAPRSLTEQAVEAVGHAWSSFGAAATSAWTMLRPVQPYQALPDQLGDEDRRFFISLETLGLKLAEVRIAGSVFPYAVYYFVAAREPSSADIERATKELDAYRLSYDGFRARAKQRTVQALLEVAGDRTYVVSAVDVELSLWPSASYEINRRDRPLEAPERRVIDALRQD
jgi:hypothetical protein